MARRIRGERPKLEGPRVNERIRISPLRVILEDGTQLGVISNRAAKDKAKELGLDLVEVSPNARPPVCKIMNFGKWKYEQSKKKRDAKKSQSKNTVKQIKFRPRTDIHDLEFKTRNARKFLQEGHKVQLEVRFKGRENAHPDVGRATLDKVIMELSDIAKIERAPFYENRSMTAVVVPK